MTRKYKTLAYRVYARSKEISAHKGVGMSMAELQRQLGLEEVGYDTFRRHVRRIWAQDQTVPASSLPPVEPHKAAASPPAPPLASLKRETKKDRSEPAFPPALVEPKQPINQNLESTEKVSQKDSANPLRKRKFSTSKIGQERIDLNPDNWKKPLDDMEA